MESEGTDCGDCGFPGILGVFFRNYLKERQLMEVTARWRLRGSRKKQVQE